MFRFHSLILVTLASLAWVSCQKISSRQDLESIQSMEKKADENREAASLGAAALDLKLLDSLGSGYVAWADHYPDAPETPEFLFRAGELYSNELQDFPRAIAVFERDYKNYPAHATAANALFFIGYLYNNSLHDLSKAEQYYKEFIAQYPQHEMAKHAQFELESLGMSPDEVFAKIIGSDSTGGGLDSLPGDSVL
jgi:tetratricopeptide (TPR) repeat protein